MDKNHFVKSHGLGNEYIVLDSTNISFDLNTETIKRLCNVHYGIGSDGVLLSESSNKADFGLRIFNPDGSEAEKSGNGLRIFAKYLFDHGYTGNKTFSVDTLGGIVKATVEKELNYKASVITIDMGKPTFKSKNVPVNVKTADCFDHTLEVGGASYKINCVSVGNPHCVIVKDNLDKDEILKFGPLIENHPIFPNKINVQFVKIISRTQVEMLIWERGAGYTLASGSSSSAVASVLFKKGLVDNTVTVKMPGGELKISIGTDFNLRLTGEARQICEGTLSDELIEELEGKN